MSQMTNEHMKRVIDRIQEVSIEEGKAKATGDIASILNQVIEERLLPLRSVPDYHERCEAVAQALPQALEEIRQRLAAYGTTAVARGKEIAGLAVEELNA